MDMEDVKKQRRELKPIARETMQMVEGMAFDSLQSTMLEVFKHGGMAELFPFLVRFLNEFDQFALECCGRGWDEHLQRAIVSSRLATEYLPKTYVVLQTCSDSQRDFERREAVWDNMLRKVSVEDRAFIESIKQAGSVLSMLLTSKPARDSAESRTVEEFATLSEATVGRGRHVC